MAVVSWFTVNRTDRLVALISGKKHPWAAHQDMYLDDNGDVISGLSQEGHLAVGVPGAVDGMMKIHAQHATMDWADLIDPSIRLAEEGFILTSQGASSLNDALWFF